MFKKIAAFFHRHPGIKTTTVGVLGAGLAAAGNGFFGPKGVVIAGAITAIAGLWTKRPADATPADKSAQ